VGDVIRALPAVRRLKEFYPACHIAWLVEEPSKGLLESQPGIDEVILFPRRRWTENIRSLKRGPRTVYEIWRFLLDLRRRKFDVVFDFHGILKSGVISILSGSPARIGFDRASSKEGNFIFSNIKVSLPKEKMSRFQKNFALLEPLGVRAGATETVLHTPDKDREYVNAFLDQASPGLRRPIIAVHPGTSRKTVYKRWMADRYALLADRFVEAFGATILFSWGPDEEDWVQEIRRGMKAASLVGPRTESLTQLAALYAKCDLYVGGDTGPMHIASMMGLPVVVIYGPTDPVINEPVGVHIKVRKEMACSPCRNRSCKDLSCLTAVTVEDVFSAAAKILPLVLNGGGA
jgi:heptosyltransferase I